MLQYIKKGRYMIMKINIQDKLKEKGISRYELAKRIGVTYPTIDNIYKGLSSSIKFDILESICKELNCSLDDILIFDDYDLRNQQLKRVYIYASKINESKMNKSGTN